LSRLKVIFHAGWVTNSTEGGRRGITDQGEIENGGLIIAGGGRLILKLSGIERAPMICEGIASTEQTSECLSMMGAIACSVVGNPKGPLAVRGGSIVALLFAVDRLLRQQGHSESYCQILCMTVQAASLLTDSLGKLTVREIVLANPALSSSW